MKTKQLLSRLLAVACAGLLASCVSAGETSEDLSSLPPPVSSKPAASSSQPEESSEPAETGPLNPLTGESGFPESAVGKRPVAVMVNNIGDALPQRGLAAADMIYEVVTEGGITRLMAVYADPDNIPYVGPVRSVRHYYVAMAMPLNPIFVHFGGSPAGYSYISNLGIDDVDGMTYTNAFYQDSWRAANRGREHSFFIDGEGIQSVMAQRGFEAEGDLTPLLTFAAQPVEAANQEAGSVYVPFSSSYNATFTYNKETGLYSKKRNGADHVDADTEQVLTFRNVLILYTTVSSYQGEAQRREVDLSSGSGWYVTGGGRQEIRWSKGDSGNQFAFTLPDGTALTASPGKTYICVTDKGNSGYTEFTPLG